MVQIENLRKEYNNNNNNTQMEEALVFKGNQNSKRYRVFNFYTGLHLGAPHSPRRWNRRLGFFLQISGGYSSSSAPMDSDSSKSRIDQVRFTLYLSSSLMNLSPRTVDESRCLYFFFLSFSFSFLCVNSCLLQHLKVSHLKNLCLKSDLYRRKSMTFVEFSIR